MIEGATPLLLKAEKHDAIWTAKCCDVDHMTVSPQKSMQVPCCHLRESTHLP
jgi:hypothetical protein